MAIAELQPQLWLETGPDLDQYLCGSRRCPLTQSCPRPSFCGSCRSPRTAEKTVPEAAEANIDPTSEKDEPQVAEKGTRKDALCPTHPKYVVAEDLPPKHLCHGWGLYFDENFWKIHQTFAI